MRTPTAILSHFRRGDELAQFEAGVAGTKHFEPDGVFF